MSHKAFRVIVAKRASICRNCGRTIKTGETKLIYQMDHPTYSSSCCRECFGELQFDEPKIVDVEGMREIHRLSDTKTHLFEMKQTPTWLKERPKA